MNDKRAARQRAKAEADRPARVDALGADVRALGLGAVEPAPIASLPLAAISARKASERLDFTHEQLLNSTMSDIVAEVNRKLVAEHERMTRPVPSALEGMAWHPEIQTSTDFASFENRAEITMRIVYRLGPAEPVK
jgi:hypothetical protein